MPIHCDLFKSYSVASKRVFIGISDMDAVLGRVKRTETIVAIVSGDRRWLLGVTPGICATKSVLTAPGHRAVTRIPSSHPAHRAAWLNPTSACLAMV